MIIMGAAEIMGRKYVTLNHTQKFQLNNIPASNMKSSLTGDN